MRSQELPTKVLLSSLNGAVALDYSPTGELYILEANRDRILKTDTLGNVIERFGSRGEGLHHFDQPSDIEVTNGMRLYVADTGNQRIQLLDRRFNHVGSIGLQGARTQRLPVLRASKIAVSKEGSVYVYNTVDQRIYRYDAYGRLDSAFNLDLRATVKALSSFHLTSNQLWVADSEHPVLHRYHLSGQYVNFVDGFDPIVAMEHTEQAAWLLSRKTLMECDLSLKECLSHTLPEKDYIDLAVVGTRVYLLTSQALYLLSLS